MTSQSLSNYYYHVSHLMEGMVDHQLDRSIEQLAADEQWELLAVISISANEVPARRIAARLLQHNRFSELCLPACLRRQVRKQEVIQSSSLGSKRIFRDFDAEDDGPGVPEHIIEEAKEISSSADSSRMAALSREAATDRDPLREYIITEIAKKMATMPEAAEALVVIAKASAFEDARRTAALKIFNHELTMKRLAREERAEDMITVANNAGLTSVKEAIARALGPYLGALRAKKDWDSLRWAARNHPDAKARAAIEKVLQEESEA